MTRTKVFVGNLSFKTKREDLAAEFQAAGRVVEANIITRGTRSLGYGFVEMESEEDAKKAIEIMNKKSVDSREINVELAKPRDETKIGERRPPPQRRPRRSPNPRNPAGGNGNGNNNNNSGSPQSSPAPSSGGNKEGGSGSPAPRKQRERKPNNAGNNNNNAGGNAAAESPKEGSKEGGAGGDRTPGSRRFGARRRYRSGGAARGGAAGGAGGNGGGFRGPRKDLPPRKESETSLFIANLPFSIDNAGLVDLYKAFNVKNAHVVANRNGKSKGFGFVELATQADQKAALDATNKTTVQGRELIVKIALTPVEQPKEASGDNQPAKEETKN